MEENARSRQANGATGAPSGFGPSLSRRAFLAGAALSSLSLGGCKVSVGSSGSSSSEDGGFITLKGIFRLEPEEGYDISGDGLQSQERYVIAIWDARNDTDKNWDSSFNDAELTLGSNSYERNYSGTGSNFEKASGYRRCGTGDDLLAHSEPVRFIATYKVNVSDLDGVSGKLAVTYDHHTASVDIAASDIQTVTTFDGCFSVEESPDDYQITRSVLSRTVIAYSALKNALADSSAWAMPVATAVLCFSSETTYGISAASTIEITDTTVLASSTLKPFDIEAVRREDAELAELAQQLIDIIAAFKEACEAYDGSNGNAVTSKYYEYVTVEMEVEDHFGV